MAQQAAKEGITLRSGPQEAHAAQVVMRRLRQEAEHAKNELSVKQVPVLRARTATPRDALKSCAQGL